MVFRLKKAAVAAIMAALALALFSSVAMAATPLIVLDPGHGGYDPGAVGPTGYQEKQANLGISLRAKTSLERFGYRVMLTRSGDYALGPDLLSDLQGRVDIANNNRANIFVSIHNNSGGAGARGTETYYYQNGGTVDGDGKLLATLIQRETVRRVATSDRGAKGANFFVLRRTNMAAALLEGAFISDPGEEAKLKTADFQQKLADGVAAGVKAYFDQVGFKPAPVRRRISLGPGKRTYVRLREMRLGADISTKVTSSVPIVAERAFYFTANGARATSTAIGAPRAARSWFMPEGYTGSGYATSIAVQNPGRTRATVSMVFLHDRAPTIEKKLRVEPMSRIVVKANDSLSNESVATKITSDVPVVAERVMTFASDGSTSMGAPAGKLAWYFAEGSTKTGYDTLLMLQNAGSADANATVRFMGASGRTATRTFVVGTTARTSVRVRDYLPDEDFTMAVRSDRPIVAERQEYVNYGGKTSGHSSIGTPYTSFNWYLAEGVTDTAQSAATKLLFWNPGSARARLIVTFSKADGVIIRKVYGVNAHSKLVVDTGAVVGSTVFSVGVKSDRAIVVERTSYSSWGVSSSMGSRYLSKWWHFPDGSTVSGYDPRIVLYNPGTSTAVVTLDVTQ